MTLPDAYPPELRRRMRWFNARMDASFAIRGFAIAYQRWLGDADYATLWWLAYLVWTGNSRKVGWREFYWIAQGRHA